MTKEDRDIQRKLKVLRHAEMTGHVARTCRYMVRTSRRGFRYSAKCHCARDKCRGRPVPSSHSLHPWRRLHYGVCCRTHGST